MKVLLREKVDKLGNRGEIVDVADGFARNYLLPRQLAVQATTANFRQLEIERARIAKQETQERAEKEAARDRLEATSCTILAPASPEGHLYGSIGAREIADALAKEGVQLDPKNVQLEQPFKEVGVYLVEVALDKDLAAKTRVWIVPQ